MTVERRQVELLEKNKPRQERAKRTYESILSAAAELLVEVGVERISTNLVAERAGITVPALYRYFPNKYAVLNALGAALMDKQNAVFQSWYEGHTASGDPIEMLDNIGELLHLTYEVTREQSGGLEIVQALRAVAPLRDVRLGSHRLVAEQFAAVAAKVVDLPVDDRIMLYAHLSIEVGYGVVEMALEDESLDKDVLLQQAAHMIRRYWEPLLAVV